MPLHVLDRSKSPSRWSPSPPRLEDPPEHKWKSFEIRALLCLIIKGEHYDPKGPVDPMDFATKLNKALNPGTVTTKNAQAIFGRDIPANDVHNMLRRVLVKKKHAVDIVNRNPAAAITRRQVNAFMRQLDFDGSEAEWATRKDKVLKDRADLRLQLEKREEGRSVSPDRYEMNQDKRREIQSPRAQKLLSNWSMGHSFYEEPAWKTPCSPPHGGSLIRRSITHDDERSASPADDYSTASNGATTHTSGTSRYSGGGNKAMGFDDPSVADEGRRSGGHTLAWDPNLTVSTPTWGTSSRPTVATPNVAADTPNPLVGGWGGSFVPSAPTPQPIGGRAYGGHGATTLSDQAHPAPTSAYGDGYDAAASRLSNQGPASVSAYGDSYGAASASFRSGAPTPAYGNGYGPASASVRSGVPTPAYGNGYGAISSSAQAPVPMSAYGDGNGPAASSNVPTPTYGSGYGATSLLAQAPAPMPTFDRGYGAASPSVQSSRSALRSGDCGGDEFNDGGERASMPPPKKNGQAIGVSKTGARRARKDRNARR